MEIDLDFGIPVMELDRLIRRALQDHFSETHPPITVWGSIQRHLVNGKYVIPERLMRRIQSGITSITQRSDKG